MPQINNMYNYLEEEQRILASNQPSCGIDWDKGCFDSIKDNIKSHLKFEQGLICAYCQLEIVVAQASAEIEHIVPKGKHFDFMFEPKNLALACRLCNTKKSTKETLLDSTVSNYPSDGMAFNIVHPHFDDYDNYIRFIDEIFVEATPDDDDGKGENTIQMCNLDRLELAEFRAKKVIIDKQSTALQQIINLVSNENDESNITNKIREIVADFQ